jgi:hypothetical protein
MGSDEPHLPTDMRGAKTDRRSPRPLGAIVPPEYGPHMTNYNRFVCFPLLISSHYAWPALEASELGAHLGNPHEVDAIQPKEVAEMLPAVR